MGSTETFMSGLGEPEVAQHVDAFFEDVLRRIGYTIDQRQHFCEIDVRQLPAPYTLEGHPLRYSDDSVTTLRARERVVATAMSIRTSLNFAQVLLADYLTPELLGELRRGLEMRPVESIE